MSARRRNANRVPLDGILLIDKPSDWTSHDVVQFVRGRYRLAKVGHAGTLDPMATGLLVLLLGKATRCSDLLMAGRKVYEGTVTLGRSTTTQDAEGETVEERPLPEELTREDVKALLPEFTGDIRQIPPMVSAIKKDGVPLYKHARKGKVVEREPRAVRIHSYEITDFRPPELDVRIVCSKGTYIRTLAHDLGERLGCGAHLSALRRTGSGDYAVENAVDPERLREMEIVEFKSLLLPVPVLPEARRPPLRVERLDALPEPDAPLVLAIGAFDGLHLGHAQVFDTARQLAVREQARVGVLRFYPHPGRVLKPESAPPLLCTEEQVQEQLRLLGVELHLRLPFTREFASLEPEQFLQTLFQFLPGLKGIVVGSNWRFGRGGRGTPDLLAEACASRNIPVLLAEDREWEGERISSTRIRTCLLEGRLEEARAMLGRPYALEGTVVHGKKKGRELGFPTANFVPPRDQLLPAAGVYRMRVKLDGESFLAAGYITRDPRLVEVHVLDQALDLYGRSLRVELLQFQRAATPISDSEALRNRIAQDIADIRAGGVE